MKVLRSGYAYAFVFFGACSFLLFAPLAAQAAEATASAEINWFFLVIGLLGGLSLFCMGWSA